MEKAGSVLTRDELERRVWPRTDTLWTNTLSVHIKILRDKLDKPFGGEPLIQTVHGRGYMFRELTREAVLKC
jgi:DNA-binding response OmpR family regulator